MLECVTCQILHVIVGEQKMADLQKKVSLMIHLSPILGWICLDPFLVKERRLELNHYGTMASRAVHIEITYSLDANHLFIQAFSHFIAYCGNIQILF